MSAMAEKQPKLIQADALFDPRGPAPPISAFSVVLTRYSARTAFAPATDLAAYLRARFPLFLEICYPTMRKQRQRPDLWLIAFSEETRHLVKPVLRLIESRPWIVPIWEDAGGPSPSESQETSAGLLEQFGAAIRERFPADADWLITTRLDNDDGLSRDYNAALLQYAAAVVANDPALKDFWISFPLGLILAGENCYVTTRSDSQFLSRCVAADQFDKLPANAITAQHGNHTRVFERGRVFLPIPVRPMWLQTVHDLNVHNRVRDTSMALNDFEPLLQKKFGIVRAP